MSSQTKVACVGVAVVREPAQTARPEETNGRAEQTIRERAHQIYLERLAAGRFGDAVSDWFEAERELGRVTGEEPVLSSVPS